MALVEHFSLKGYLMLYLKLKPICFAMDDDTLAIHSNVPHFQGKHHFVTATQ